MSETVTIHWDKVRDIEKKVYNALGLTGDVLQDDIRQAMVVPRDTGNLQGEAFLVDKSQVNKGLVRLIHITPYGRRLYYHPEYHFRKDKNPYAQGLWFRPWQKGGTYEDRPQQIFEAILKREL